MINRSLVGRRGQLQRNNSLCSPLASSTRNDLRRIGRARGERSHGEAIGSTEKSSNGPARPRGAPIGFNFLIERSATLPDRQSIHGHRHERVIRSINSRAPFSPFNFRSSSSPAPSSWPALFGRPPASPPSPLPRRSRSFFPPRISPFPLFSLFCSLSLL